MEKLERLGRPAEAIYLLASGERGDLEGLTGAGGLGRGGEAGEGWAVEWFWSIIMFIVLSLCLIVEEVLSHMNSESIMISSSVHQSFL